MADERDEPKPKKKKKKTARASSSTAEDSAERAAKGKRATASGEPEMRSPIGPLLWLLIPFVLVIVYGLLTRD